MNLPEPGRQAMHVLLDAMSVWRDYDDTSAIVDGALARLQDVGAVTATMDAETEELTYDASDLLGGVLTLLQRAISELAERRQVDREIIVAELREFTDSVDRGGPPRG